eukprot:1170161-Prymnesium_polylepis.1
MFETEQMVAVYGISEKNTAIRNWMFESATTEQQESMTSIIVIVVYEDKRHKVPHCAGTEQSIEVSQVPEADRQGGSPLGPDPCSDAATDSSQKPVFRVSGSAVGRRDCRCVWRCGKPASSDRD